MRTTPAVTTLLAAIALLAAACGEEASTDAGPDGERAAVPASAPAQPPATDGPWVVRFEVGSDEMPSAVSYVRFVPDTGETRVTTIQQPPLDVEPNPLTLVDAGRSWAVLANAASFREQRQGTVTVHSLESKAERRLDLVELTGRPLLRPLGWAFDPAEPGLLRVLDRSGRVYEVDVDAEEVTGSDRVQVPKGYALAPVFDSATGLPLLREKRTYEYQSGGEYAAGGLSVVDPGDAPDTGVCRDEAALTAAVVDGTGTSWSACLQGDAVRLASQADDVTEWTEVGESAADVPAAASSMTWVLPPL